ncbi:acetyltransferase [Streptomyces sp. S3(2020)]|uniref:peptidase C39 family protein n=1 Tax=Streptomyces sp. S3(2020) TaxID=2732044 RepID=UPI0014884BEE|nr:peptidase C39 family protein [Streptomyces sp. S3(2020)]NNN29449.1 acetyltransferase [Streptomyces sp. S3(2020)]
MPSSRQAPMRYVVVPFERASTPLLLRRHGLHEVPERWHAVDRSAHAPVLVAVPGEDGEQWIAAALVTARPGTAYLKIVDAVGDVPAAAAAVIAHAREQRLAQVKWEGWTASPEEAAAAGFTALDPPLAQSDGASGPPAGYVRWLGGGVVERPPYYGQSTHFTCGAVTALVAQTHAGILVGEDLDRQAELTLWREATNFPACEPVGLGVAVRRRWPSSHVTVHLDTDRPVLLDHLDEKEQDWRAVLQRSSRAHADRIGVSVDPRRLALPTVRDLIGRGQHVLLLLSLAEMQGFDVPHWVLCHGAVEGAVVIDDPWAQAAAGDTWVDAHLLPVPEARLDAMSTMASDGFRGAVSIG